jgi:phosphoribosyl-ATP pyrophosphohydrolase
MLSEQMTELERELLIITMEECAELAMACSKLLRFGDEIKHRDNLIQEAGDVMCMATLLVEHNLMEESDMLQAVKNKRNKLKMWSSLIK